MPKSQSPSARKISLDDKYALDTARAYMTGIEALARETQCPFSAGGQRGFGGDVRLGLPAN